MLRWLSLSSDHSGTTDPTQPEAVHHNDHNQNARGAGGSAFRWLSLRKFIDSHFRDILDESDEILHSRFQLIYTIGSQQHMDGYLDRWMITQQVLRLVKKHIYSLSRQTPDSVQYECGPPGSFPHVRIMHADIGRRLITSITEDVMAGRLPSFNFRHISPELQNAIRGFISDEDVLQIPDTAKMVEEYAKGSDQNHLWGGLLLLRGLLTSNILVFALSERKWRVDYGHASLGSGSPSSSMLAVPYRAKDVPAPNTQFGHPDLTIILTCLSCYYSGLSKEQLKIVFEILLNQDNPSMEYSLWKSASQCQTPSANSAKSTSGHQSIGIASYSHISLGTQRS